MELRKKMFATCMAVFATVPVMGQQQSQDENDWLKDLSSRITLNGYAQAGWDYQNKNGVKTNSYNMKRVIVWGTARITDRWSFRIMNSFVNNSLLEYYTDYRISNDNALNVRFGQFKNSYSLENPMSPSALELIDVCSQSVTYLGGSSNDPLYGSHGGRDLGLMIYGDVFKDYIHYELGLMNGQGINVRDRNNNKDLVAKLEVRPVNGLRIVASGYLGKGNAVATAAWNPSIAKGDNYTRNRYSVGAEYKWAPYSAAKYKEARPATLRAEWLGGKDGEVGSRGGYVTTTIPLVDALDMVSSIDSFNRCTTDADGGWDQTNFTLGLQYWFYKKCRVQLQYTRSLCGNKIGSDYDCVQAQMQVAF